MRTLPVCVLAAITSSLFITADSTIQAQDTPPITLKFVNQTDKDATLYWLEDNTPQGRKAYGVLPPNQEGTVQTYPGHKWQFTNGTTGIGVIAKENGTHTLKSLKPATPPQAKEFTLTFINNSTVPAEVTYYTKPGDESTKRVVGIVAAGQTQKAIAPEGTFWHFTSKGGFGAQGRYISKNETFELPVKGANPMGNGPPKQVTLTFINNTTAPAEVTFYSKPGDESTRQVVGTVAPGKTERATAQVGTSWQFSSKGGFGAMGRYISKDETFELPVKGSTPMGNGTSKPANGVVTLTFVNNTSAPAEVVYYSNANDKSTRQIFGTVVAGGTQEATARIGGFIEFNSKGNFGAQGLFVTKNETITLGKGSTPSVGTPNLPPIPPRKVSLNNLILQKINAYRATQQRGQLRITADIQQLCQQHSQDMANRYNGQIQVDHNGAQNRFDAIQKSDKTANRWAENVFCCTDTTDEAIATQALNWWKNSPGHNANMLGADFTTTGLSAVKKNGVVYVTQMFAASQKTAPPQSF